MKINRYNQEGYPDPTPYQALTNMEAEGKTTASTVPVKRWKPLVYICSPYSGDVQENTRKARSFCKFAVHRGAIPVAPHLLYPQFMDENNPTDRELGLFFGIVLLTKCEEVWVFGSYVSPGMAKEIRKAETRAIPVKYFGEDCQEVTKLEF